MSFDHPVLQFLQGYDFILGSSSPRRQEILVNNLGIKDYTIVKSTFEENLAKENISDVEYVTLTSKHKIASIVDQLDSGKRYVVLTADTIVSCGGHILEKPETKETQMQMLKLYREHPDLIRVITAVNLYVIGKGQKMEQHVHDHEITKLKFNTNLDDGHFEHYVNTEEGLHVAGGFMYQSLGTLLFSGIEGDYFNVVGLPASKTFQMLEKLIKEQQH